jgi:hypothetical protein
VLPTSGDFAGAVQALKDATALLSNNFASLDSWYSAMGNVVLTAQDGTEYTARTFKQMDADVQAIQDNNQAIIDDSVSEKIAKIRYSKLDNPLCHLFKKNKLVDTLKGELSWTRNSGATYIDRYGVLKTVAIDEASQEKDGWLMEGASTNSWLHNTDFVDGSWGRSQIDVTLSPENDLTNLKAHKMTPSASVAIKSLYQPYTAVAGEMQTITWILKAGELKNVHIGSNNVQSTNYSLAKFNLATGEIISGGEYVTQFKKIEGGAYIVSVSFLTDIGGTGNFTFQIYDNLGNQSWANNGTDGLYVYTAQVEPLGLPSSIIMTTDAPATRARDTVSFNPVGNMPSLAEGYTIAFSVARPKGSGYMRPLGMDEYSFYYARLYPNGNLAISSIDGASIISASTDIDITRPVFYVISQSKTDITLYIVQDGVINITSKSVTNVTAYPNPTKFVIGNSGHAYTTVEAFFGHFSDFRIYDFSLNADEVSFLAGE